MKHLNWATSVTNIHGARFSDELELRKAFLRRLTHYNSPKTVEEYLNKYVIVRHKYGAFFIVRTHASDLYNIMVKEEYELKSGFCL